MNKKFVSKIKIALTVMACAGIISCSKYDSPLTGQTVNDVTMEATVNSCDVTLGNSDLSNIKATSNEVWCMPSVSGKSVHVSVQANDTYKERQAVVTLTDSEDGSSLSFNVIQKQNNVINTSSPGYYINENGGAFILKVETNIDFKVEIPEDCNWLTNAGIEDSGAQGLQTVSVHLIFSPNEGDEHRFVIINLVNRELDIIKPLQFYQLSKGKPSLP